MIIDASSSLPYNDMAQLRPLKPCEPQLYPELIVVNYDPNTPTEPDPED